jgi:hypothetical protein
VRALVALMLLCACDGTRNESGFDQPFRVRGAQFVEGSLPTGGGGASVTVVETLNNVVFVSQANKRIGGRTTKGATGVGMRFADLGTGFYRIVTENPDPAAGGEQTWSASLDFASQLPAGLHALQLVAFDAAGQPGAIRDVPLCIASAVPDNLAACDPKIAPPVAVITLTWDTNVDLDLQVVAPDGKTVDPKHPKMTNAIFERDSNPNCSIDGLRRESIVWQGAPQPGTYLIYANLFDACGQQSVRFNASVYSNNVEQFSQAGQLLAADANGGSKTGLYLTNVTFE